MANNFLSQSSTEAESYNLVKKISVKPKRKFKKKENKTFENDSNLF